MRPPRESGQIAGFYLGQDHLVHPFVYSGGVASGTIVSSGGDLEISGGVTVGLLTDAGYRPSAFMLCQLCRARAIMACGRSRKYCSEVPLEKQ